MILFIFVIICSGLIVKKISGESLRMASEEWKYPAFLGATRQAQSAKRQEKGAKHKVLICAQQKFGAQVPPKPVCLSIPRNAGHGIFCLVELKRAVSVSATLCQLLKKSAAESATLRQISRHRKTLKNQQRVS